MLAYRARMGSLLARLRVYGQIGRSARCRSIQLAGIRALDDIDSTLTSQQKAVGFMVSRYRRLYRKCGRKAEAPIN